MDQAIRIFTHILNGKLTCKRCKNLEIYNRIYTPDTEAKVSCLQLNNKHTIRYDPDALKDTGDAIQHDKCCKILLFGCIQVVRDLKINIKPSTKCHRNRQRILSRQKVTTLVVLGGSVALLNYFRKIDEEESLKIILAVASYMCPLNKIKGIVHYRKNIRLSVRKWLIVFRVKDGSPSPFWAWRSHLLQQIRLLHLLLY